MKRLVMFSLIILAVNALGVVEIGQPAPNFCYTDINMQKVCLNDLKGQVVVLIFNAGWCGPCNSEMAEMAPASQEFANKPVTFISLSGAGWSQGSSPNQSFLKEWKSRHNIPDKEADGVNFIVASAPNDFGKSFIAPPIYIPNGAVLDKDGILVSKGIDTPVEQTMSDVRRLLEKP